MTIRMSSGITPSQLLEIRRVKAMVAGAGTSMDPQCFLGPTGPTGPRGPAGSTGNYGVPASLGYYNETVNSQLIANATPVVVTWASRDINFSQGITGVDYSAGRFYNVSDTDSILANVTGFISFTPNPSGIRAVYARVNGVSGNIYGYAQVSAAASVNGIGNIVASSSTIVPFSFNVYLSATNNAFTFFEIFVYQDSGNLNGLTINSSTSRISITRINTTMMGPTGATGPIGPASVFLGAADFYLNATSTVTAASEIPFNQSGPALGTSITRVSGSDSQFNLATVGVYNVSFNITSSDSGTLAIFLNSVEQVNTAIQKGAGISVFSQTCLIPTTTANTVLSIRNKGTSSLTITPLARITITKYS